MANWSLHKKQQMVNNGDFEEEDVWSMVKAREVESKVKFGSSSSSSSAWQYSTTPRAILRGGKNNDDMSSGKRSSAPVNIPDWSEIYGRKKNGKIMASYTDDGDEENDHGHDKVDEDEDEDEDGYYDDEDEMVPPHEWLARKLARSQISSFSVCEGIGRTLKGRDLSRVRNAILSKTGFLE